MKSGKTIKRRKKVERKRNSKESSKWFDIVANWSYCQLCVSLSVDIIRYAPFFESFRTQFIKLIKKSKKEERKRNGNPKRIQNPVEFFCRTSNTTIFHFRWWDTLWAVPVSKVKRKERKKHSESKMPSATIVFLIYLFLWANFFCHSINRNEIVIPFGFFSSISWVFLFLLMIIIINRNL